MFIRFSAFGCTFRTICESPTKFGQVASDGSAFRRSPRPQIVFYKILQNLANLQNLQNFAELKFVHEIR